MFDQSRSQRPVSPRVARRLRTEDCIVVDKRKLRKAQIGAGVGNFIEWYDIGIYGYLAVTMTSVFTEGMDERMGLLVTLLGFAVSFVVRPLGGMILGPLGDRVGRRRVLFFTMALMAAGTTIIGMLPTAGQVGLWVIVPLSVEDAAGILHGRRVFRRRDVHRRILARPEPRLHDVAAEFRINARLRCRGQRRGGNHHGHHVAVGRFRNARRRLAHPVPGCPASGPRS
jgi:hypothetical protein